MNINAIVLGCGLLADALVLYEENEKTHAISRAIRLSAARKAMNGADWVDVQKLKWDADMAKINLDRYVGEENSRITVKFNQSEEAKEAVKKLNKLTRKYDAVKKIVDNYKPNQTQVAVGNGDSSVAISVEDSSKKADLDLELADITAKKNAAKADVDNIRKAIADEVRDERPIEHTEALEKYNSVKKEYDVAVAKNNQSTQDILDDTDWKHKEFIKEFQARHNAGEIVAKSIVLSIVPAWMLCMIWKEAIGGLNLLKEVV